MVGGFRRELAPAAALALTKHEAYLVCEDKASSRWFQRKKDPKYGYVVTYLPLVRLAEHRIHREAKNALLELETHATHGGEALRIMLPLQNESQVAECLNFISPVAA